MRFDQRFADKERRAGRNPGDMPLLEAGRVRVQGELRCQAAARIVAQVCNWWNLFVRGADPQRAREAITAPGPENFN